MSSTPQQVMEQLASLGTEQTRRTYLRHGAAEPLFGVKFGDLRPLARRLGTDHTLAQALWATRNSDARLLACMVADPDQADEGELDAWLAEIDSYFLVDTFVRELAAKVPGRLERADRWIDADRDRTAQAGWDLLSLVALSEEPVPEGYLEAHLARIAERMVSYGNWTRRAASNAITAIGLRSPELEAAARETAARMGRVDFDPGQTACVMPDPIEYLEETKAHRARRAAKSARAD